MKKFVSIKTKLVSSTMLLISIIFILILSLITIINIISVQKNIAKSKDAIWNAMIAKGKILVQNNSMAMTSMAEDNAFTAIQALVSSTVKDDADIIYGIYTNEENIPWVNSTKKDNSEGVVSTSQPLTDSISLWAAELNKVAYKIYKKDGVEVLEFAAPVISRDERLGTIRYGLGTTRMIEMIKSVQVDGKAARNQSILLLSVLCIVSLITGYIVIYSIARKIMLPIATLVNSSKVIAEGNYNKAVIAECNDEIGNLAEHFEVMRLTIKKYTDHLQDIIDEKMQQVNDILNNIDQGLFTINLDGTVNKEYSARANEILKVEDIASHNLNELLRLDPKQKEAFDVWLNVVRTRHNSQRWKKLVKLAPVQELELIQKDSDTQQYVSISYQKIYNKQGDLAKIMVLAMDETDKRMKELQMLAERQKHENEVKAILGIANTPPEEIAEFTEDTSARLKNLHNEVEKHLVGVKIQRENYPDGPDYHISSVQVDVLYRNLHTIKGNAGSYGFELLSAFAHKAEDMLEELREPIKMRRGESLSAISSYLDKMDGVMEEIHHKIMLIFGKDEDVTVRVPENRIQKIQHYCSSLDRNDVNVRLLVDECMMLTWKPLKTLARKYLKTVQMAGRRLNKNVEFYVTDEMTLYYPEELTDIDDILVHLVRNAVDHGIEPPEVREELSKGVGRIRFEYHKDYTGRTIIISDDGKGIDTDALVEKCIQKKILIPEQVPKMTQQEKFMLMFHIGISTAETVTSISGRGIGMNVVMEKIKSMNGSIKIDSQVGKGTMFTVCLPV